MKFAVFALVMLFGAIACQSQTDVQSCIADLKQVIVVIDKLAAAAKDMNIFQITSIIIASQKLIMKTRDDCKNVKPGDIAEYRYEKLSYNQQQCLLAVLRVNVSAIDFLMVALSTPFDYQFVASRKALTDNVWIATKNCLGQFTPSS